MTWTLWMGIAMVSACLLSMGCAGGGPSYVTAGEWGVSSLGGEAAGSDSYWTYTGGSRATWRPAFDGPVRARVWMHKIVYTARNDPDAEVFVRHDGELEHLSIDFGDGETGWVELGVYDFAGGEANEYVRISRPEEMNTRGTTTRASGVRFEVLGPEGEVLRTLTLDQRTAACP